MRFLLRLQMILPIQQPEPDKVSNKGLNNVKIWDHADEFRVELCDRFAGAVVEEVLSLWTTVLRKNNSRRFYYRYQSTKRI